MLDPFRSISALSSVYALIVLISVVYRGGRRSTVAKASRAESVRRASTVRFKDLKYYCLTPSYAPRLTEPFASSGYQSTAGYCLPVPAYISRKRQALLPCFNGLTLDTLFIRVLYLPRDRLRIYSIYSFVMVAMSLHLTPHNPSYRKS